MRALFAALVVLAAAVVVAVVLGPRVAGGGMVQSQLRHLVEEAAGRDLVVQGRIGVDLFPRLRLSLAHVTIGDPLTADERVRVEADRVDLDVSPVALMAGRLEVRRAQLVRPRIIISAPTPGSIATGTVQALRTPRLGSLEMVRIADGQIEIATDPAAPPRLFLDQIDGTLRRDQLLQRMIVALNGTAGDAPLELQGEIGEVTDGTPGSLRFQVVHGAGGHRAKVEFRGFGMLDVAAPTLKGQFNLDASEAADIYRLVSLVQPFRMPGHLPKTAPILLDGQVELADGTLDLSEVTARLGRNTLDVSAEIGLARRPRLTVQVAGSEFVADAATVDDLTSLASLPWWTTHIDGKVGLRLGYIRWRDHPIRQLRAELKLGSGGIRVERLTASLPGTADLSITGALSPESGGPRFVGSLSLSADEPRATLAAFGVPLPELPESGLRAIALTSELVASRSSVALRNFELRLDGARVTGSAALVPGTRPRFAVSASADRLDLDLYLPQAAALDGAALRERLMAFDAAVDLNVARVGLGDLWGENLYLRASLEQGLVKLNELGIRDLAEARLRVVGSGDLPVDSFQLAGELEAERPTRLLRALGFAASPNVTRLAPIRLSGTARGSRGATEIEVGVDASGLSAQLTGSLGPWFDATGGNFLLDAKATRLDELLHNLGLSIAVEAPALARPLHLSGQMRRSGDAYAIAFETEAPPSQVSGQLTFRKAETATAVAGKITGGTVDRDLLEGLLPLVPARFGGVPPGQLLPSWLGRLPSIPLDLDALRKLDIDVGLEVTQLQGFGPATTAGAHLRVVDDDLTLDHLRLPFAGGTLTGTVSLTAAPDFGTVGIDLALAAARAERVLEAVGIGSGPTGELALTAQLAASGRTLPELVGDLAGEIDLRLRDGSLPAGALAPGAAPLPVDEIAGELEVDHGIATSRPPGLELVVPGAEGTIELQLDLLAWMVELAVRLEPPGLADQAKTITRRFIGPPPTLRALTPAPAVTPVAQTP